MSALRVIQTLLGILVGLFAIIVLLAFNLDFGRLKPQAESLLSDILQRPFVINGPLHLTLDLERGIELNAANVSLASSQWSVESHLVSLRSLEVRVNFQSLLRRPIVIDQLLVDGLRVNLEQDGEGNNNWSLFGEADSPEENEPEAERFQLPVLPVDIRLTDAALAYASPDRSQPLRVTAGTISEVVLANGEVRLAMDGQINDTAMAVEISSSHFEALISMLDVELGLKGHLGEIIFDGKLAVSDLQAPRRPTASLRVNGPNIEYLIDILKLEQVTTGPLNLAIDLAPEDENMLLNMQGVFGEFNVTASGRFRDLQQLEVFELETSAHGPDIGRVARLFGVEHVPPDPFTFSGRARRAGVDLTVDNLAFTVDQARLAVDGEFSDFPSLNDAQARMNLDVPDIGRFSKLLRIPGTLDGPLLLDASLATPTGSDDTVVEARASSNEMSLRVDGTIVDAANFTGADVHIAFDGPTLQTLTTALGLDMAPDLPFQVRASLSQIPGGIAIREALVDVGVDQLTVRGKVANQPLVGDTNFSVDLAGPNLAQTLKAYGIVSSALPLAPYRVSGGFQRIPEHFLVKNLVATLGQERVTIEGIVGSDPLSAETRLAFDLASPALKLALASFGVEVAHLPEVGGLTASGTLQGGEGFVGLREIEVAYADTTAKFSGRVTDSPSLDGTALQLQLSGQNLAQLLPPNERLKRLAKPFSLDAAMRIEDAALIVEGADFRIDQTQFQLDSRLGLDPLLEYGSVSLTGNSADILPLTSKLDEITVADRLPLKLQSQVAWLHDRWSIKELDLLLGKARLTVDGALQGPPDFGDTNLQVHGTSPSLAIFSLVAGRELPDLPARMKFSLIGDGDKILLQGFAALIGKSDVRGDFSYRSAEVPEVTVALTSKQLNLTPFLPSTSGEAPAKTQASTPAKKRERVIPDTPIPTDILRSFLAKVSIRVNELTLDAHTLQDVELAGSVADGAMRIDKVGLKTPRGGRLDGALALLPSPDGAKFYTRVNGHSLKIGLPARTEEQFRKLPRYSLDLALNAEGSTVRELAGAANGYLRIQGGQGQIEPGSIRLFTNDFLAQLVETLNPFEESADPNAQIRCATVLAALEGGQLSGKPIFVLQTERLNIFANAKANLRNEKLEASFKTVPQKGLGVSMSNLINPFVKVTGTLANPALSLDGESTLIRGGAAIATGGLSILAIGLNDRFMSPKDPCGHAFIEADEGLRALEAKYGQGIVKD